MSESNHAITLGIVDDEPARVRTVHSASPCPADVVRRLVSMTAFSGDARCPGAGAEHPNQELTPKHPK